MKVVYTETHWLEFDSRFASTRPDMGSSFGYIGFGCKMPSCNFPDYTCVNCPFSFTYNSSK